MSDSSCELRMPVRLVPRRSRAIGSAAFVMIWILLLALPAVSSAALAIRQFDEFKEHPFYLLILGGPTLILILGSWHIVLQLSRLLPSSPFDHIIIDHQGVTSKRMQYRRAVAWNDVGRFVPFEWVRRSSQGRKRTWLILAEGTGVTSTDDDNRMDCALLYFQAAPFGAAFAEGGDTAQLLSICLNDLLAQIRDGKMVENVVIPDPLMGSVWKTSSVTLHRGHIRSEPTLYRSPNSVIER